MGAALAQNRGVVMTFRNKYDGELSIAVRGSLVEIEIFEKISCLYAFTATVDSEKFLAAIARGGNVPIQFWMNETGKVGATRETKTESVPFDYTKHKHPPDEYRTSEAVAALAPFEVDGWIGEERDLWNGHNRVFPRDGNKGTPRQTVSFVRFLRDGVPL